MLKEGRGGCRMDRLVVQHRIARLKSQVVPPVGINNFYNLLGVGRVHTFAADVEFPAGIPVLNVFARFVNGTGVKWFEVELVWFDSSGMVRSVENLGFEQVTFRPGELRRDVTFRYLNVPIGGVGEYALRLRCHRRRRLRVLAHEYFSVEQLP
jgi:hypothetical protein